MKNPLVDVIRQSTGSEQTLSDSGSFDTKDAEFGPTANDEAIEVVRDDELALLEATGAIVLDDGTISFHVSEVQDDIDAKLGLAGEPDEIREFDPERAPLMSRYAPVFCLAAALLAAAGWSAYTRVDAYSSQSSIGVNEIPQSRSTDIAGTVHIAGASARTDVVLMATPPSRFLLRD
ncbi:MAG: hypothetical protein AAFN50_15805 [Pseudomonadota bacterium]